MSAPIGLYLGNNLPRSLKADWYARTYGMGRRKRLRHFLANLLLF
jgi:hypothetical protein